MLTAPTLPLPVPAPNTKLHCFHCQDECPDASLRLEDKYFCCEGCQLVYQILNTHDLCQFYSLDERPGRSQKTRLDARSFAWLDDPEVKQRLIQFTNGQTTKVTFFLPAIHCASCLWLLEHLFKLDAGILHSRVNFLKKEVTIQFTEGKTSLRQIAALLSGIGYPPEINLGDVSTPQKTAVADRSLYYKIGVAGFAFGNIMLLSFPEYLGLAGTTSAWFFNVFGYLNLLLAIPVLVYSGSDYFRSAWNGLRNRHLNIDVPLALGMAMLFGRSAWEICTGAGAGYMDSFAGLVFFLLTGRWFQQKTYHHLSFERDYKSYFPVAATRKNSDGTESAVPVNRLEPGDIIRVRHGELAPADGILLKGKAQMDYSFVTGEAEPVTVQGGEPIYAGGKQQGETIEISLTRRVNTSYLTQLWNDEAFKSKINGHASLLADRAGRYFTTLILGVATIAFIFWFSRDIGKAINAFTAVLIIACPCAVALSIPFTMGNVLRILGRNRFYVKNTQVLEAFSTIDAVVFDKTGTITDIAGAAVLFIPLADAPHETGASGVNRPQEERIAIKSLVMQSNHPRSRQIAASMQEVPVAPVEQFTETAGQGIAGMVAGKWVRLGTASFILSEEQDKKGVFVEINRVVLGYYQFKNQYRAGLPNLIGYFKKRQAELMVLSGDNSREREALSAYFPDPGSLCFDQSPQQKLAFIKEKQQQGKKVLMLGDGLNDAGALRQSDIGIVVAENTNNFTPACDAILHAAEFERLPLFLDLAQWGMTTVNRAYLLAACYNLVGLSYAVSGTLSPVIAAVLMPLSSITIVLFGFGMSHWKGWKLNLL